MNLLSRSIYVVFTTVLNVIWHLSALVLSMIRTLLHVINVKLSTHPKMASQARNFHLYKPSVDSAKTHLPSVIEALKPNEKLLSIELMPSNSLNVAAISKLQPAFCSVIWRQSESFNYKRPSEIGPLALSKKLLDAGHNVLLHLSGRYLKQEQVVSVLDEAKAIGVRNIFALKGEYIEFFETSGDSQYQFKEAADLIKFIRDRYQDYFSICVAGYPDRHPRSETFEEDTQHLLQKIEAGADLIVTQAVFNAEQFTHFIKRCRDAGITVPIFPGLWLFDTYERLHNCANFCKVKIDAEIWDTVENLKSNPTTLRQYGTELIAKLTRTLLENDEIVGVHWFSLNDLELVGEIIRKF